MAAATYGEAVAEGGALGGGAVDRSGQAAGEGLLGLERAEGLLGAEAVVKAHREPARCHGHCVRGRAGWGGWRWCCCWCCWSSGRFHSDVQLARVERARAAPPPANQRSAINSCSPISMHASVDAILCSTVYCRTYEEEVEWMPPRYQQGFKFVDILYTATFQYPCRKTDILDKSLVRRLMSTC